jgi:hypothetical protein
VSVDPEARDTFVTVELELPNKQKLQGRIIPWRKGMQLKALLLEFIGVPSQENLDKAFAEFSAQTGLTEAAIMDRCPDISIGELVDLMNRFTYLLRDGRTAAVRMATPAPTSADPSPTPEPSPAPAPA